MAKKGFGELETAILKLFTPGTKRTVKEVHQLLGKENKYNTVMTVMLRLADKQILTRERVGLQYEYWLAKPDSATSWLKRKILGIKPVELLSYLVESVDNMSDQEISEMEKIIETAKKKRNS